MKPAGRQSGGGARTIPKRVKVWRGASLVVLIGLIGLGVYGRCLQMRRAESAYTARGLASLAAALSAGDGVNDSALDAAERAFHRAAREVITDPYPRFCISVIRELRGGQALREAPPSDWEPALDALRANQLDTARARFATIAESDHFYAPRAALFLRLIDDLRAASQP